MREFLVNFAKEHKLEYKVDKIGNVAIFKPATKGYENAPKVIMQGHMDMVCEKDSGVEHDFEKDPIKTIIDGEWVHADHTTLGADNGIGVAAGLAVLIDDKLVHGPIQILATVDEETGLTGATNVGKEMVEGDILLNLDSEEEAIIIMGCAGGIGTKATFEYKRSFAPPKFQYFKITFSNLQGGHSGSDIDGGRACANKLLARFLWNVSQKYELELSTIDGGNLHNAIAHDASAVFGIHSDHKEHISADLNKFKAEVEDEYKGIETDMNITLETVDAPEYCIDNDTAIALIRAIYCAPHGVFSMSRAMKGLVETSTNLASVKMKPENKVVVEFYSRSSVESRKMELAGQIEAVFQLAGAKVKHEEGYPGWEPNLDSNILKKAIKAYQDLYNITPMTTAIHAGLECGLFLDKNPKLDMISFGPTLRNVHSPRECMHIPAVEKFWNHLTRILEMVAKGK
jgi:dipeptidase D